MIIYNFRDPRHAAALQPAGIGNVRKMTASVFEDVLDLELLFYVWVPLPVYEWLGVRREAITSAAKRPANLVIAPPECVPRRHRDDL